MADNFTQFSLAIKNLTPTERTWLQQLLALDNQDERECKQLVQLLGGTEIVDGDLVAYNWPDFCHDLSEQRLWVYAEDFGSAWNAALLVRAFLASFRPQEVFCFSVAFTCSKLHVDEFGGEAYVVTGQGIYSNADVPGLIIKALQTGRTQTLALRGLDIIARPRPPQSAQARRMKEPSCLRSR